MVQMTVWNVIEGDRGDFAELPPDSVSTPSAPGSFFSVFQLICFGFETDAQCSHQLFSA